MLTTMNSKILTAALGAASLLAAGCSGGKVFDSTTVTDGAGPGSSFSYVSWTGSSPKPSVAFDSTSAASVLALPGLGGDFVFEDPTRLVERPDGSATLQGWLSSTAGTDARWWLELDLETRRPADSPECSPHFALEDGAYAINGGPVDPSTWHYYLDGEGVLVGNGSLAGALVQVTVPDGANLQCGEGADNLSTDHGAQVELELTLIDQPLAGPGLSTATESGMLAVSIAREATLAAFDADMDPIYGQLAGGHALYLPGIGTDFVFRAGGELFLHGDGSAELMGEVMSLGAPERRFLVDVHLAGLMGPDAESYPPVDSPKLELRPEAYVANGGPVDPARWLYFTELDGRLIGRGELAGARLALEGTGPSAQLGRGANGKNLQNGLASWIRLTLLEQPDAGPALPTSPQDGDFNLTLTRTLISCAREAFEDALVTPLPGDHAFWLPGIGTDFVLRPGGHFIERSDGTAVVRGIIERENNPAWSFRVDVRFSDRRNPGAPDHPPAGSPKKDLYPAAYVENGGPVDTALWHYYAQTEGELIGLNHLEGAVLDIEQRGPAFQVGEGASGMNLEFGASSWITTTTLSQPTSGPQLPTSSEGDINLTVERNCKLCPREADSDPVWSASGSSHALTLPGIASDLVFEAGSTLTLGDDGSVRLEGVVARKADATRRFAVDVAFCTRLDPGDVGHAPEGSPKLELYDSAYVENGGPVDPSTWVYFTETKGVLTGLDAWAGAVVKLSRMGPAFQLGEGANGKNVLFGGSGWLVVECESQPDSGESFDCTKGDFNLEIVECP